MKKLLMKLFPKFFNVTNYTSLNFDELDVPMGNFNLVVVDDESDNTFDKLGISDERGEFLYKIVKKAIIDSDCRVDCMKLIAKHVKHVNEFYIVTLMVERESAQTDMRQGMGELLKVILTGKGPEDKSDGK